METVTKKRMEVDFKEKTVKLGIQFVWYAIAFFQPIIAFVLGISALVVIDYHVGVKAARYRGDVFKKDGWKRSMDKIWLFFLTMLAMQIFSVIFADINQLVWSLASFIALMELKSIISNVGEYNRIDYWNVVWDRLSPIFKSKPKKDE